VRVQHQGRTVGNGCVELEAVGVAPLGEETIGVADARAEHPRILGTTFSVPPQAVDKLRDRRRSGEVGRARPDDRAVRQVSMSVDQAGHDDATVQLDNVCRGPNQPADISVGANGHNAAMTRGQGGRGLEAVNQRQDAAAVYDQVGGERVGGAMHSRPSSTRSIRACRAPGDVRGPDGVYPV
jgi:hypothetical protein